MNSLFPVKLYLFLKLKKNNDKFNLENVNYFKNYLLILI